MGGGDGSGEEGLGGFGVGGDYRVGGKDWGGEMKGLR